MNGATSSLIYNVRRPDGVIYKIPEHNLDYAVSPEMGGEVVGEPFEASTTPQPNETPQQQSTQENINSQKIYDVKRPDGVIYKVPEHNLDAARKLGGVVVDPEYDGLIKTGARSAKSIASGAAGSIPDTITSTYNIPAVVENAKTPEMMSVSQDISELNPYPSNQNIEAPNLPLIPSATEAVDKGIDETTGGYTKTKEGDSLQTGLKMVGAIASPGGLARGAAKAGAKGTASVLAGLGTTKPIGLAGAGAAGAVSSEAEKAGYGGVASAALGLGAGAGVGLGNAVVKNFNAKLALAKLTGNSPKNIDLNAVKAFEEAGLSYTNTTVNKSKGLKGVEEIMSKAPYFGTKQAKTLTANDKEYAVALEEAIAKVGEKIAQHDNASSLDTGNIIKEVFEDTKAYTDNIKNELYADAIKLLPTKAEGMPSHLSQAINKIRKTIKTLRPSTDEMFLLKYLDDLEAGFVLGGDTTKTIVPVPVEMLVGTKRSLNDIINWDVKASGVRNQLKQLQHASQQDIEAYGKTNPKWYESYKKADSFYGQRLGSEAFASDSVKKKILDEKNPEKILGNLNDISDYKALGQSLGVNESGTKFFESIKREKLSELLLGKVINPSTESVNYTGFVKAMENPRTKELVKYLAGDKYNELYKFLSVAKAAVRRNARIVNPSGTAPTNTVINTILAAITGGSAVSSLANTAEGLAAAGIAGYGLNWFVTNKSALKWGIEAAKKQAKGDSKAANIISGRIERSMIDDLGDDFVRQFIAFS